MFPVANAASGSLDSMITNAVQSAPVAAAAPQATSMISQLPSAQATLTPAQAGLTPQAASALQNAPIVPNAPQSFMGDLKSTFGDVKEWWKDLTPTQRLLYGAGGSMALQSLMNRPQMPEEEKYKGPLSRFKYDPDNYTPSLPMAEGGIATLGGANIAVGGDPRRNLSPTSQDGFGQGDLPEQSSPTMRMADGGIASLGSYSDGGRLLKGPGDGMSDHIPAMIGRKQPARLAEGEFVIPADVVSHLGNGSTDAGAKQLYAMMNKVRKARTGNAKQGRQINPSKYLRMAEGGAVSMASGGDTSEDRTAFGRTALDFARLPFFQYMSRVPAATPRPEFVPSINPASTEQFYRTMDTPQSGYRVSSSAAPFYQPIYQGSYQDYSVGNPLSISQYGTNPGIAGLLAQFSNAAQANSAAQSGK
jgi:hypothetical protein